MYGYELTSTEMGQEYLSHHGVKGQKWGVRNFQNTDGTYTEEGKQRRRHGSKSRESKSAIDHKALASTMKKNANGYKKEKYEQLDDYISKFHPALHQELGTKRGVETRNYLIDAVKGFNEGDIDNVTYQHMDMAVDLHDRGYLNDKTFNKLYDAQAAEDAVDWLGYGIDSNWIHQWNSTYKRLNKGAVSHSERYVYRASF